MRSVQWYLQLHASIQCEPGQDKACNIQQHAQHMWPIRTSMSTPISFSFSLSLYLYRHVHIFIYIHTFEYMCGYIYIYVYMHICVLVRRVAHAL